jgi:hypothetical protein
LTLKENIALKKEAEDKAREEAEEGEEAPKVLAIEGNNRDSEVKGVNESREGTLVITSSLIKSQVQNSESD